MNDYVLNASWMSRMSTVLRSSIVRPENAWTSWSYNLKKAGRPAFAYHAGLGADEREKANCSFRDTSTCGHRRHECLWDGSGPTGRARVIHAQMPGTVEAYYQEAGRAGRDGLAARCLLMHSPGDIAIHEFFNRQSVESVPADRRDDWERHRQDQLDLMRRYAYGAGCRQQAIMDYFGDVETLPEGCGRCDNCQTPEAAPVDDRTQETVRILLSGAARLDGRFGGNQLADLVTGSDTAQIRRYNHQELPTYGRLRSMTKRQVQAMIQALVRQGYLRSKGLRYPLLASPNWAARSCTIGPSLDWVHGSPPRPRKRREIDRQLNPRLP